ncbi:CBS domain-containing protein [Desulfoscipio sp. XC116]|uniref:CBS domain-containing protein n=1 Tax=Desulfoscipio sp. XC116 TaxID=3144975 RepID=UPI00325B3D3F
MAIKQAAGAFMVPLSQCPSLSENAGVYHALAVLKESLHGKDGNNAWRGHRMAVVYGEKTDPLGILTLKNILQAVHLKLLAADPYFKSECFSWYYIKELHNRQGGIKVREIMRPLQKVVMEYNCSVSEAAQLFAGHGINYLPVKEGNKFVGILNARDLFYHYYELSRFNVFRENNTNRDPAEYVGYATV